MIQEMYLISFANYMGLKPADILHRITQDKFLPGNMQLVHPELTPDHTSKVRVDLRLVESKGGVRNMKYGARVMNVYIKGQFIGQLKRVRHIRNAKPFMYQQCPDLNVSDLIIKYADTEKRHKDQGKPSGNFFYSDRTGLRLIEVYYNGQLRYIDEDSPNINTAREKYFETHPVGGGFFARYKRENQKPYGYMAKKKAAIAAKKQAEIDDSLACAEIYF